MVLKELLHYDEEANTSFLKEVSYLERVFAYENTQDLLVAFVQVINYIKQLYSGSGKKKGGLK